MDSLVGTFIQTAVIDGAAVMYAKVVEDRGRGWVRVVPVVGWGIDRLAPYHYEILAREDGAELLEYLERLEVPDGNRPTVHRDCAELIDFLERIDEQVTAAPVPLSPHDLKR